MTNPPRKKLINLYALKKTKRGLRSLRRLIFDNIGDELYTCTTEQDFIFTCLKELYPLNRKIKNTPESIDTACLRLFSILPIRKAFVLFRDKDGKITGPISPDEQITSSQRFLSLYLQIKSLPADNLLEIKKLVEKDIHELTDLIRYYESLPFIRNYLSKGEKPRNHQERMFFDFYNRCIKQHKIIIDYYFNGIKKRALSKSNRSIPALESINSWTESFYDRPYYFSNPFSEAHFDHRKIDLTANKTHLFNIKEEQKLSILYNSNKSSFYRILFKRHKPDSLFQKAQFYLSQLPLINDRKPIFDELKVLFKQKRWIGYYALALTQIEGLFSEMNLIISPQNHSNSKSLPDKVEEVRPFYDLSDYHLDYYQYHIPTLRNKFMHSGFDDDFKLKSCDLLLDITYLLQIFFELNNPLVKITKLHKRRNHEDFISFEDFADYFALLNELPDKHKSKIEQDILDFEKNFLVTDCGLELMCSSVMQNFAEAIEDIRTGLEKTLHQEGKILDVSNSKWNALLLTFRDDTTLRAILRDFFLFRQEQVNSLALYKIFFENYKKYLPSLHSEYASLLTKQYQKNSSFLKLLLNILKVVQKPLEMANKNSVVNKKANEYVY